jgi:hypothetical protein
MSSNMLQSVENFNVQANILGNYVRDEVSHPVLKAKPNALITCAPGSSYTHA